MRRSNQKFTLILVTLASMLLISPPSAQVQNTTWVALGPFGEFNNEQTKVNGRLRSIEIRSIPNDYYVFVGVSSGGLWRSLGSAPAQWTNLGNKLPNPSVGAFAVHPNNIDNILVGTGDLNRYQGSGMFRTSTSGQNWVQISITVNPNYFFRILYLPGNTSIVLAATDSGLLRSIDGGVNWTVVLTGIVSDLVIDPSNAQRQYACRSEGNVSGVYRSDNGGVDWTLKTASVIQSADFGHGSLAVCQSSPTNLAVVYAKGNEKPVKGVLRSSNSGDDWTRIDGLPVAEGGEADHALAIAFRPTNASEIYVGANRLWQTTNGGTDWLKIQNQSIAQ